MTINNMEDLALAQISKPTKQLRWIVRDGEKILQQAYAVKTYRDIACVGVHAEWRDVPTEPEES